MNSHAIFGRISRYFRQKRMREFERQFRLKPETQVLDVGGSAFNWSLITEQPSITLLNLYLPKIDLSPNMKTVQGDGRSLQYAEKSFDIVYSNSVIEHLGSQADQNAFANEVRRVGRSYYVQTPNKWFPVEPHYLTPGIHFLPKRWQVALLRNGTVWGWITRPDREKCRSMVDEIRLLDSRDMTEMFPEATIQRERFLGVTKSIVAVFQPLVGEA